MKKNSAEPAYFNWRRLGKGVLVASDMGGWAFLTLSEFSRLRSGRLRAGPAMTRLEGAGLLRSRLDLDAISADWHDSNEYLEKGPGLHIMVLTQRCNHACDYCQAGSGGGGNMSAATARKAVDFAFSAPVPGLTIEFQGGEPLVNWPVLKETVIYARKKAGRTGKELALAMVSNLSLMTREKAEFIIANDISVCTSLDGPASLHNANRPYRGGNSHALTEKWIRYFQRRRGKEPPGGPAALLTVTRASLARPGEIVDEYARLDLPYVFLRPLMPFGAAAAVWDGIGYGPEEFVGFYGRALRRILDLNLRGKRMKEKTAFLIAKKILGFQDNRYVDLRCPCGAGLGQLAYDVDGGVYTCDEGRMLAMDGDVSFRAGHLRDGYRRVISSLPVRACAVASSLDLQPVCSRCVYRPYCGVCPAYNRAAQGGFWGSMPANGRCRIMKGIFDTVFSLTREKSAASVFWNWLEK